MSQPAGPVLGVLAVALDADRVLMVQRKNAPDAGLWGYPGGHVELGETAPEAALRELCEETGLTGRAGAVLGTKDVIHRGADGAIRHHFFLVAVACEGVVGVPVAADDAGAAAWVAQADVLAGKLAMSDGVDGLLRVALDA